MNGGERDECCQRGGEVLVVFGQASVAAEPREGALHHPAPRQDDEAFHVVGPFDDLDAQAGLLRDGFGHLARVVATVGPNQFEPVETLADLVEGNCSPGWRKGVASRLGI